MESHQEMKNSLVYTHHTKCTHKDMHYCNKCYHRKMFQDKNIPFETYHKINNNITTTYTILTI